MGCETADNGSLGAYYPPIVTMRDLFAPYDYFYIVTSLFLFLFALAFSFLSLLIFTAVPEELLKELTLPTNRKSTPKVTFISALYWLPKSTTAPPPTGNKLELHGFKLGLPLYLAYHFFPG